MYESLLGYNPRFNENELRKITYDNESYNFPTKVQNTIRGATEEEQGRNVKYELGDIVFVKRNPTATEF